MTTSESLPSFFDLRKENCFSSDDKIIAMETDIPNFNSEDDLMIMDLLFKNDGLSAIFPLTPNSTSFEQDIEEIQDISTTTQQPTFIELGTFNEQVYTQFESDLSQSVIVQPAFDNQPWQTAEYISQEDMIIEEYIPDYTLQSYSYFPTPPESVSSLNASDNEDKIIKVHCSDNETKILTLEIDNFKKEVNEIEKLIKKPSKRGRPRRKIEDLEKETTNVKATDDEEGQKIVKVKRNNVASNKYRAKKSAERQNLDHKLAVELAKFKELERIHSRLESEIHQLKLLQFALSQ